MLPDSPIFGLALVFREGKWGASVSLLLSLFEVKPNKRGPILITSVLPLLELPRPWNSSVAWTLCAQVHVSTCRKLYAFQFWMGLSSEKPAFEFLFPHFLLCNTELMTTSVSLDIPSISGR